MIITYTPQAFLGKYKYMEKNKASRYVTDELKISCDNSSESDKNGIFLKKINLCEEKVKNVGSLSFN